MLRSLALAVFALPLPEAALAQCGEFPLAPPQVPTDQAWGQRVTVDGSRMAVLAGTWLSPFNGYVDVLLETATGWTLEERIDAPPHANFDARFGRSFALRDDRLVIGSPNWNGGGRALVYERSGGQWSAVAELQSPTPGPNGLFGWVVELVNDQVLVSAPREAGGTGPGSIHVFELQVSGAWTAVQRLDNPFADSSPAFGLSMDLSGDVLAVTGGGRLHLYELQTGAWQSAAFFDPPPGEELESAAAGGDLVLCRYGLTCPAIPTFCTGGRIRIVERTAAGWSVADDVEVSGADVEQAIGDFAAIDGDDIYVRGAGLYTLHGPATPASVYRFRRGPSGWRQTARWSPDELDPYVDFGFGIAAEDGRLFVSMPNSSRFAQYAGGVAIYALDDDIEQFCLGTGPCPCGNDTGVGGCANGSSDPSYPYLSGTLEACGSTDLSADDLVVRATHLAPLEFGLLVMGHAGASPVAVGDGLLCLDVGGTGIARFGVRPTGAEGAFTEGPGLAQLVGQTLPAAFAIAAGSTWSFQAWYRDPNGPCGSGSNLTNAVRVTFRP